MRDKKQIDNKQQTFNSKVNHFNLFLFFVLMYYGRKTILSVGGFFSPVFANSRFLKPEMFLWTRRMQF